MVAERTVTVQIVATGESAPALTMFAGQSMLVYRSDNGDLAATVALVPGTTAYQFSLSQGVGFSLALYWSEPGSDCAYGHPYEPFGPNATSVTAPIQYHCPIN